MGNWCKFKRILVQIPLPHTLATKCQGRKSTQLYIAANLALCHLSYWATGLTIGGVQIRVGGEQFFFSWVLLKVFTTTLSTYLFGRGSPVEGWQTCRNDFFGLNCWFPRNYVDTPQCTSASCPFDQQQNMLQSTTEYFIKICPFCCHDQQQNADTTNNRMLTRPTTECYKNRHSVVGRVSILLLIVTTK